MINFEIKCFKGEKLAEADLCRCEFCYSWEDTLASMELLRNKSWNEKEREKGK